MIMYLPYEQCRESSAPNVRKRARDAVCDYRGNYSRPRGKQERHREADGPVVNDRAHVFGIDGRHWLEKKPTDNSGKCRRDEQHPGHRRIMEAAEHEHIAGKRPNSEPD